MFIGFLREAIQISPSNLSEGGSLHLPITLKQSFVVALPVKTFG